MEEYESRLVRAFEAQTAAALNDLAADLPVEQISRRDLAGESALSPTRFPSGRVLEGLRVPPILLLACSVLELSRANHSFGRKRRRTRAGS